IWSDDGIIVHLPDADEPPRAELVLVEPDQLEDLVVGELAGSALFGARFRENAARALLIPRAYPGRRTPLWQQRLKAQSLLEVARRYGDFPVILETYRECLRDVLDPAALAQVEDDLQHRSERTRAANRDALHDVLRRVGDLTDAEVAERVLEGTDPAGMLERLRDERRAVRVRLRGDERWIAAED